MGPIRMVVLEPGPDPAAGPAAAAGARREAVVRFLDAEGRPVGRRRRVTVEPAPYLEASAATGTLARWAGRPLIAFTTRLPVGAKRFRLDLPGRLQLEAGIRETASPRPRKPGSIRRFGSAEPRFLLAALAERFASEAAFHARAAELLAAIEAARPFDTLQGRVAVDALFWSSDPDRGLFGPLTSLPGTDLLYGDRALAAAFLARAYRRSRRPPDRAIVLLNLPRRGGAGGDRQFPTAWTSITSAPHERWTDIALHEIGHALGLGDEYDSHNPNPPPGLEPNISPHADPQLAPWAERVTHAAPAPTAVLHAGAGLPADTIGTFQGARYSSDLFRAQFRCRMRSAGDEFCAVCCDLIRARLG